MAAPKLTEELLDTLGISDASVREALLTASRGAASAITVRVNTGDEKKYGDVSVLKTRGDFTTPVMGLRNADIPGFIEQLQAAYVPA